MEVVPQQERKKKYWLQKLAVVALMMQALVQSYEPDWQKINHVFLFCLFYLVGFIAANVQLVKYYLHRTFLYMLNTL